MKGTLAVKISRAVCGKKKCENFSETKKHRTLKFTLMKARSFGTNNYGCIIKLLIYPTERTQPDPHFIDFKLFMGRILFPTFIFNNSVNPLRHNFIHGMFCKRLYFRRVRFYTNAQDSYSSSLQNPIRARLEREIYLVGKFNNKIKLWIFFCFC